MTTPQDKARQAIGRALLEAREKAELSQQTTAEQIGSSASTISRWENGERPIKIDDIARLAAVMNTTAAAVLQRTTELLTRPGPARRRARGEPD